MIIMVSARVFDAANDPMMGCIIEKTRTRYGKFKPWLCAGILSTSVIVWLVFNVKLQGWAFVGFFGVLYFLYSITYTMHDIAYWSMIPSLSSDANRRNQYTSRTVLFAGIGGMLASILIPVFTAGDLALGGDALTAYGQVALIIAVLAPLFLAFTVFGVKEKPQEKTASAGTVSFRAMMTTISRNRQLLWIALIFLLQQVSYGLISSGLGQTYIYLKFGYNGAYYSICQAVGVSAIPFLMIFYPAISRKITRKALARLLTMLSAAGSGVLMISGFLSGLLSFILLALGFMCINFGQNGLFLILTISLMNTIEYNEYQFGARDESVIASLRPFLTKLSSAINIGIVNLTYIIAGIIRYTNGIASLEQAANAGGISAESKAEAITALLSEVRSEQPLALLAIMSILPCLILVAVSLLYRGKYTLDEQEYDRICKALEERHILFASRETGAITK